MRTISRIALTAILSVSLLFTGCSSLKKNKAVQFMGAAVIMGAIAQDVPDEAPEKMKEGLFQERSEATLEQAHENNL